MKTNAIALLILLCLWGTWAFAQESLQMPRINPIMVNVTGSVEAPGQYTLTAHNRLSDALQAAKLQGISLRSQSTAFLAPRQLPSAPADSLAYNPQALRSVRLSRGGQSSNYDLMKYYRAGDISQNPLLRDGDIIFVPVISKIVTISGQVHEPGDFEYLPTDKLSTLIELAQGLIPSADLARVKIYRYSEDMLNHQVLDFDLKTNPALMETALMEGDRVLIPQDSRYRGGRRVKVQGKVQAPGEYLVSEGMGIYELLMLAGGPLPEADLANAIYMNVPVNEMEDPEFVRLRESNMSQMTSMEYAYLRTMLRQIKGRYSVNIARVWSSEGSDGDLELRDGDLVFVPEEMNMVWVSGQVKRPGLVRIEPGKDWRYYIEAAGGYASGYRSGRTRIIRAESGNWIKPNRNIALLPGDTIFVPERIERDFWVDLKDVVLLATQVITIVVGVSALTK